MVSQDEQIAADILLIKSSFDNGICYIDTMNLDGETNLKEKIIHSAFKNISEEDVLNLKGFIICDKPNDNLEKWESSLTLLNYNYDKIICSLKQLVLKGCVIKNTEYIIGIVVYTGHDTKIMKNTKTPTVKISNVMRMMNSLLYSVFIFQICLCILFALGYLIWQNYLGNKFWYLSYYDDNEVKISLSANFFDFFIKILTYLVSYSHLIPISLYVALEIVKIFQLIFIFYDNKMYDRIKNKPAISRTSDLIEELGQVEFIFSDKTGTLTKNEMEFKKCSVNSKIFGEDSYNYKHKYSIISPKRVLMSDEINSDFKKDKEMLKMFFTICCVCHSAFIEEKSDHIKVYQSSSPDEIALLEGAKQYGYQFSKKTSDSISILTHDNQLQRWVIILELPFDADRKRMSVIAKHENIYYLLTKGADSSMLDKMRLTEDIRSRIKSIINMYIICSDNLEIFAQEGLRTLVMGQKILNERLVHEFKDKFNKIMLSDNQDKDILLANLFEEIESDLNYVGSSGIEDKLADEVPQTIDLLLRANIKIWVLTGDKKVIIYVNLN
jgi:phospholipid-translocating P-type ATPase (flippase)